MTGSKASLVEVPGPGPERREGAREAGTARLPGRAGPQGDAKGGGGRRPSGSRRGLRGTRGRPYPAGDAGTGRGEEGARRRPVVWLLAARRWRLPPVARGFPLVLFIVSTPILPAFSSSCRRGMRFPALILCITFCLPCSCGVVGRIVLSVCKISHVLDFSDRIPGCPYAFLSYGCMWSVTQAVGISAVERVMSGCICLGVLAAIDECCVHPLFHFGL